MHETEMKVLYVSMANRGGFVEPESEPIDEFISLLCEALGP